MTTTGQDSAAPPFLIRDSRFLIPLGWIAVVILLTRPYRGVFHDGHLYAVQALRRLDGSALDRDVFFAFGNQDSFSVFTWAYAPVIATFGVSAATVLFYAVGLIGWAVAMLVLARTMFTDPRRAILATAFSLCLYSGYGNLQLGYGEGFVTPRIIAEAFGFVAVALTLQSRRWLALIPVLAALALHPLMGLSIFALWFWLICRRKLWFFVGGGVAFAAGAFLGAVGIAPFTWMFEPVKPAWMALVQMRAPIVLVSEWPLQMLLGWLPLPLFALLLIWREGSARLRDLVAGVMVIGFGFTALSLILADLIASRFFVGLQLWRAGFLIAAFGNLLALKALGLLKQRSRSRLFFRVALALSIFCFVAELLPFPAGFMAYAAAIAWLAERRAPGKIEVLWQVAYCIPLLAALLSLLALMASVFPGMDLAAVVLTLVRVLMVACALWMLARSGSGLPLPYGGAVLVSCLLTAWLLADLRTDRQLFWARGGAVPVALVPYLKGKTVYWEGELVSLWIGLRMPQFYSCRQSGGMVFFQAQATEIFRRAIVLRQLNTSDFESYANSSCPTKADASATGPSGGPDLAAICKALPELDTLILQTRFPALVRAEWAAPFGSHRRPEKIPVLLRRASPRQTTNYHVYDCGVFRK